MIRPSQSLLVLLALLAGCSDTAPHAPPAAGSNAAAQKITPLGDADRALLARQEAVVLELLQSRFPDATLARNEADLAWLQRLIDERAVPPQHTYQLQCLGAVLGQVIAANTPLEWVVVEDQLGRDLGLRFPKTSFIVFPITMISKRIERSEEVDVATMYRFVLAEVAKVQQHPEQMPPHATAPAGS